MACVGFFVFDELLRTAAADDRSAVVAAFGTEVDDIVGGFDHVEIMLDDENGVAVIDEAVEDVQQTGDIGAVQTCGGFIQDLDGIAGTAAGKLRGQFNALGFAAAERCGALSEFDIAESHVL